MVGIAGDISHEAKSRVFRDMLDVCQVRGRDSTGVIKVTKGLEYDWAKQVGPPNVLCDGRLYERRIEQGDSCVLVGHTRSKTVGDISVRNAHPFDYPDEGICGVHNGTLRSYHNLEGYTYQKVDSEVLYGHLAKNGPQDTFSHIEGAWACVWWNQEEKTLNFIRNSERPLWFTWSKDLKMMFWASEAWMFGAVSRKIELWDGGEKKNVYIEMPPNQLWSFRINPAAKGDEKIIMMRPIEEILPQKKATPVHQTRYGSLGGNSRHETQWANEWVELENGDWVRKTELSEDELAALAKKKGGSVPRPFDQRNNVKSIVYLPDDPLDDLTQGGSTSSALSNVTFLRNSVKPSGSTTPQTGTKNSPRNLLSLPGKNSSTSLPGTSVGRSSGIGRACPGSSTATLLLRKGVSYRKVAGIEYVTNNATKDEYDLVNLVKKTGPDCIFCKTPINSVKQVGEFMGEKSFICTSCLEEPKGSVIQAAL